MSEPENRNGLTEIVWDEVTYIQQQFAEHDPAEEDTEGIRIEYVPEGGGLGYMYAAGQLLVRRQYLAEVERVLDGLIEESERERRDRATAPGQDAVGRRPPAEPVIGDIFLLRWAEPEPRVPVVLEVIDAQVSPDAATPNHVLTVASNNNPTGGGNDPVGGGGAVTDGEAVPCPATEPEQVVYGIEPFPSACPGQAGAGARVFLADTGLLREATDPGWLATHPWLAGVRPARDHDFDHYVYGQAIHRYTGHGTFVAGVTRCLAPGAEIIVARAFRRAGSTLESHLARRLDRALGWGTDIFHLTVASPSRHNKPMIAIGEWLTRMHQYKGTVCVCAAGNSRSRRPFWPGAFPGVVTVGALAADGRSRASFSNYGGWVDVYAPGRDLVNAYATGRYTGKIWPYGGETRRFYGMARWSGTSFSTPIVTGMIAARMTRTGENGREAAHALLAEARRQAVPGVGAILLPRCDGEGCCPPERPVCGCQRRSCDC